MINKNATLTKVNGNSYTLREPSNRSSIHAISFIDAIDGDIYIVFDYSDGYRSPTKMGLDEAIQKHRELINKGWIPLDAYYSSITTDKYGRHEYNK